MFSKLPEVGCRACVPGLVFVMPPARIPINDTDKVVPRVLGRASVSIVHPVARSADEPVLKTPPSRGFNEAVFGALISIHRVSVIAFLSPLNQPVPTTVRGVLGEASCVGVACVGDTEFSAGTKAVVGSAGTSDDSIAGIHGAGNAIVAIGGGTAGAHSILALISKSACIPIVAACGVGKIEASLCSVAALCGAHISVVALGWNSPRACPPVADIDGGAGIVVVAGGRNIGVGASPFRVTAVRRTHISVIAIGRRSTYADALVADIGRGAGVPIVTGNAVGRGVNAAGGSITAIGCAHISIVALGFGGFGART